MPVTSHTFLFYLNNCFSLVPPGCPRARRGSPARRQAAWPGLGTCRVLLSLWTACWLWTVAAGGGNQSPFNLSLSFYLSIRASLLLPQPPAECVLAAVGSFMFTCRKWSRHKKKHKGGGRVGWGGGAQCNSSSNEVQWFLRIKGIMAEKTNKAGACSHDHPILDWGE